MTKQHQTTSRGGSNCQTDQPSGDIWKRGHKKFNLTLTTSITTETLAKSCNRAKSETAVLKFPREKKNCSSGTQTALWMKLTKMIQQAVRITPPVR